MFARPIILLRLAVGVAVGTLLAVAVAVAVGPASSIGGMFSIIEYTIGIVMMIYADVALNSRPVRGFNFLTGGQTTLKIKDNSVEPAGTQVKN